LAAPPPAPDRKPRDDEIEICGLTPRKVPKGQPGQFLVCQLCKQMVVQLSSLADAD
jgi:hypothetical protein